MSTKKKTTETKYKTVKLPSVKKATRKKSAIKKSVEPVRGSSLPTQMEENRYKAKKKLGAITTTRANLQKLAAENKADVKKKEQEGFDTYSHMNLGRGKATLAIRVKGEQVEVGVSFCSPKDQFSKSRGRLLAEGRLNSKRGFYYQFKRNEEHLKEQAQNTLIHMSKDPYPYNWSAERFLISHNTSHSIPRWATR